MSMDTGQPLKPQETVIYLLGELKGQVGSLQGTVASSAASQAAVNLENKNEHAEFRKTLSAHADELTALRTAQPVKVSPWQKAGIIIAIPASVIALVGFIVTYLAQTP
jgi:hypothetical protein